MEAATFFKTMDTSSKLPIPIQGSSKGDPNQPKVAQTVKNFENLDESRNKETKKEKEPTIKDLMLSFSANFSTLVSTINQLDKKMENNLNQLDKKMEENFKEVREQINLEKIERLCEKVETLTKATTENTEKINENSSILEVVMRRIARRKW